MSKGRARMEEIKITNCIYCTINNSDRSQFHLNVWKLLRFMERNFWNYSI